MSDPQNHFGFVSGGTLWIIKLRREFQSRAHNVCELEETKIRVLENKVAGGHEAGKEAIKEEEKEEEKGERRRGGGEDGEEEKDTEENDEAAAAEALYKFA